MAKKITFFGKNKEKTTPEETADEWLGEEGNMEQLDVDVYQTENNIVIVAPMAGVDPEKVEINISDDTVTIKGETVQESKIEKENYLSQECFWGIKSRTIILPTQVALEKASATFKNSVLTITLPKASKARTKTLKVKVLS